MRMTSKLRKAIAPFFAAENTWSVALYVLAVLVIVLVACSFLVVNAPEQGSAQILALSVLVALIAQAENRKENDSRQRLDSAKDLLCKAIEPVKKISEMPHVESFSEIPQLPAIDEWRHARAYLQASNIFGEQITNEAHRDAWEAEKLVASVTMFECLNQRKVGPPAYMFPREGSLAREMNSAKPGQPLFRFHPIWSDVFITHRFAISGELKTQLTEQHKQQLCDAGFANFVSLAPPGNFKN